MIKKRYILGIVMLFFMLIAVASAVDGVSAAKYKKIDQGKKYVGDGVTTSWNAYYNGKTVKTTCNFYIKVSKESDYYKYASMKTTLTKTSKTKLKSSMTLNILGSKSSVTTTERTSLTAKSYYTKYFRKAYTSGFTV